jgi:hypothetical protein
MGAAGPRSQVGSGPFATPSIEAEKEKRQLEDDAAYARHVQAQLDQESAASNGRAFPTDSSRQVPPALHAGAAASRAVENGHRADGPNARQHNMPVESGSSDSMGVSGAGVGHASETKQKAAYASLRVNSSPSRGVLGVLGEERRLGRPEEADAMRSSAVNTQMRKSDGAMVAHPTTGADGGPTMPSKVRPGAPGTTATSIGDSGSRCCLVC